MEPAPSNGEPPEETSPEPNEPIDPSAEPESSSSPAKGFPITFSGVASFAETGWGRLLGWQFLMALALGFVGGAVVRSVAFYVDRQCPPGGGWRLAAAAQLPAVLLWTVGVLCYALGLLPWMGLLVLIPVTALVAWGYLFFAPFFLPKIEATGPNPFEGEDEKPNADDDENEFTEPIEPNPFQDTEDEHKT